jgi:hypothetical protein
MLVGYGPGRQTIPSGRAWFAARYVALILPPVLAIAILGDWASLEGRWPVQPLWVSVGVFPVILGLALFAAWVESRMIAGRIEVRPEGMTWDYGILRRRTIDGPWDVWTPKSCRRLVGTVNFEYRGRVPFLAATVPQARSILNSAYAPAWELPPEIRRVVGNSETPAKHQH